MRLKHGVTSHERSASNMRASVFATYLAPLLWHSRRHDVTRKLILFRVVIVTDGVLGSHFTRWRFLARRRCRRGGGGLQHSDIQVSVSDTQGPSHAGVSHRTRNTVTHTRAPSTTTLEITCTVMYVYMYTLYI